MNKIALGIGKTNLRNSAEPREMTVFIATS